MGMLARLLMNLHCRIGPWPSGGAAGRRRQIRSALWCTARAGRTRTSRRSMCGISSRSFSYATPSPRRPTPRVSTQRSSRGLMCVASMGWGEPYRRPVNGSHARERACVGVSMKTRARRPKRTAFGTHGSRDEMPRQECSGDPSQPATPPHDRRHDGPQPPDRDRDEERLRSSPVAIIRPPCRRVCRRVSAPDLAGEQGVRSLRLGSGFGE
jgi:hypothetical protein